MAYACLIAAILHSSRHKSRIAGQSAQQTTSSGAFSFPGFFVHIKKSQSPEGETFTGKMD
jgi:hypothetical protein